MSRSISITLLDHLGSSCATTCHLLVLGPLPDASYLGFTDLDHDLDYNPHDTDAGQPDVLVTCVASSGVQLANLALAADGSIGNTEGDTLTPLDAYPNTGITAAMIANGAIKGTPFRIYKVNYKDLTMGHVEMLTGVAGEARQVPGGLITLELREWTDLLRQNSAISVTSLTCRSKRFGSQAGEEREYCGYDATGEPVTGVAVTSVGSDATRDFTASSLAQAANYFAPGRVLWTTGANAGIESEVRSFGAGGVVGLRFSLPNNIQATDEFDIQRDCSRQWSGHNSCDTYGNRPNFQAEPFIPTSNVIALTVPGAGSGGFQ